jgi:hypothetical protein
VILNDLIRSSLSLIGDMAVGQQPNADDGTDAIFVLNAMLDAWKIERLTIYDIGSATFSLVAGQQTYTYGPGGNFNATRPDRIERANLIYTDTGEALYLPIQMLSMDQWASIRLQNIGSPIPTQLYAEPSFPLMNVSFLPYPTENQQVQFYTWTALGGFSAMTDTVNVPPGYVDAIRYNLAAKMALEWGRPLTPELIGLAQESKAKIKDLNLPAPVMMCDPAMTTCRLDAPNWPNVLTGWY